LVIDGLDFVELFLCNYLANSPGARDRILAIMAAVLPVGASAPPAPSINPPAVVPPAIVPPAVVPPAIVLPATAPWWGQSPPVASVSSAPVIPPPVLNAPALSSFLTVPSGLSSSLPSIQRIRDMVDSNGISVDDGQVLVNALLSNTATDAAGHKRNAGEIFSNLPAGSVFGYDSAGVANVGLPGANQDLLKKHFKIKDYLELSFDDDTNLFEISSEGVLKTKPNKKRCKSLSVWMTASFKILIELQACPILYAGYLAYMRRISALAEQYDWFAILEYDRLYRSVRREKLVNWDSDFPHLLSGLVKSHINSALAGYSSHSSYNNSSNKKQKFSKSEKTQRKIALCDNHNTGRGCSYKDSCKYPHVCSECGDSKHVKQYHHK
jgi:hypothetical protein